MKMIAKMIIERYACHVCNGELYEGSDLGVMIWYSGQVKKKP